MRNYTAIVFVTIIFASVLFSCKPGVPKGYIQPDDMGDILYDYHIADGMSARNGTDRGVYQRAYRLAVLKKHDVTQAEFDSSMVYYMRHADRLHDIYEDVSKRLSDEAVSLGSSLNDMGGMASLSAAGDTVNIWSGERSMLFVTQAPFNQASYSIKTDTAFHKGDIILLNFNADFIYQDGMRDGLAVIAVRFANDSVASQVLHISSSSGYALQIKDDKRLGLKEVKGFFLLNYNGNGSGSTTTLQLMSISHIKLIRIHQSKDSGKAVNKPDSVKVDSADKRQQINNPNPVHSGVVPADAPMAAPPQRIIKEKSKLN